MRLRRLLRPRPPTRQRPVVEELEPRILYSADPASALLSHDSLDAGAEVRLLDTTATTAAQTSASAEEQTATREIVFIDERVPDYQPLIEDIMAQDSGSRRIELILLNSDRDGIEQVSQVLRQYQDISAVHFISHGADGQVQLGSTWLTFDTLRQQAGQIQGWGNALTAGADLLIYGCDVAATSDGRALVDALGRLTGADVAASDDPTGSSALGGDWTLEYASGAIDTSAIFDGSVQKAWSGVLAISQNGSATSTLMNNNNSMSWSHTVASGTNQALFVTLAIFDAGASVSSVTFGGAALTQVGRTQGNHAVEIWKLEAPQLGEADVVVKFGSTTYATGGAVTYKGVAQTASPGTYASSWGTGTTASTTVSSASGDLVLEITNWNGAASGYSLDPGQTSVWSETSTKNTGKSSTEAGAATVTMSSTVSSSAQWEMGAVSIKAAPNTAPTLANTALTLSVTKDAGAPSGPAGSLVSAFTGGISDPDSGAAKGIAITTTNEASGTWYYTTNGGTNWTAVGTVSAMQSLLLADNASSRLYFAPGANYNGTASSALTLRAWDQTGGTAGTKVNTGSNGGTTAFSSATDAIDVTVTAVNDAPVIVPYGPVYNTSEDAAPITTTVAAMVGGSISDVDSGASSGIALYGLTVSGATLKYSLDGSTWSDVGPVSSTAALLLRSSDYLRLTPDSSNGGTILVSYRAWDQTSGSAGTRVDAGDNGGTTAFSSANDQVTGTIASVNDAPVLAYTGLTGMTATDEDTISASVLVSDILFSGLLSDADAGAVSGIAVLSSSGLGTFQYSTDGATWTGFGTVSSSNALLLTSTTQIRYVPDSKNGETSSFTYKAWDRTSGTASTNGTPGYADAGAGGGTTAYSTQTNEVLQVVMAVNDAPKATITPATYNAAEQTSLTLQGTGLSISDVDAGTAPVQTTVSVVSGSLSASAGTTGVTVSGSGTGTLTLSGTLAQINALLAGNSGGTLSYLINTDAPPASDTLTLTVNDLGNTGGGSLSGSDTATINITAVNDPPALGNGGSAIASETNDANPFADIATLTDADSADFSGGTLTATISTGGESADKLYLLAYAGVSTAGATVLVSGVTVGTWSGGTAGTPLVVSFNANATPTRAQAVYQAVTFSTTSDAPTLGVRTISVVVTDGDGGTSNTATGTVNLSSAANDAPAFSGLDGTPVFTEGAAAVVLDANVTISDAELSAANNFAGATLTLARNGGANAQDVFSASGTLGALTQGGNLTVGGTTIGTVTTNSAGSLVLTFNASATNALVNSAMQQIACSNSSDAPPASVQIDWTFEDGNTSAQGSGGALQATGSVTVAIAAVNDAPVLTSVSLTLSEGQTVTLSGANFAITDPDSADFTYTVSALSGGYFQLSTNAGTPITSFTSAQLTDGSVQFVDDGDEVAPSFSVSANDGAADSDTRAATITYTPVNDAPVLTSVSLTLSEGQTVTLSGANFAITDPDSADFTYTVSALSGGYFQLSTNAGLAITSFTSAQLSAGSVQFVDDGDEVAPSFSVTANDGADDSNPRVATIHYTTSNDTPTFSAASGVVSSNLTTRDHGYAAAVQADGKLLVAGSSRNPAFDFDFSLTRYNIDGSLDTTFNGTGYVLTDFGAGADAARAVAVQPDGKILVGGRATVGGLSVFALARYNADGTLDTTFNGTGKVTTSIANGVQCDARSLVLQADGKIVLSGTSGNGSTDIALARYNANGTLDSGFNGTGKVTIDLGPSYDRGLALALQADGKLLVAGDSNVTVATQFAIVRLNGDGTIDTAFGSAGKVCLAMGSDSSATAIAVQADGAIVVGGYARGAVYYDFAVARLQSNGSLDTSFNGTGKVTTAVSATTDQVNALVIQSDGKIVAAGTAEVSGNYDFAVVRYNANGSFDTSFNGTAITSTDIGQPSDTAYAVVQQLDGKLVVVGDSIAFGFGSQPSVIGAVRYTTTGSLDTQFGAAKTTLDAMPTYVENHAPVVLDGNTQIFDVELSAAENFSGATLTLVRNGGTNADDVFSASGTLGALTQGGNLTVGGTTIGTVTTNSAGTLLFTFTSSASNALVNSAMQQIAYSNSSEAPPASVQIDWTFDDGNSGAQGTGAALTATGSTTVAITPVNDAPTSSALTLTAMAEDSGARVITAAELLGNASDVEGNSLTVSNLAISSGSGALVDNENGTWTYTPALNDDSSVSFSYTITDNGTTNGGADAKSVAGTASLDITPVNDAPTSSAVTLTAMAEDSGARTITAAELLGNASDVEGNSLTVSNLAISSGSGALVDNENGTWTYTPALNDDSSVSFSYTITDNGTTNGASDPKSVAGSATLDITPVNDAPTSSAVTLTAMAEDSGARTITAAELLGNASDVEGNSLTVSNLAISSGSGALVDNENGTWTYTPALNDDSSVSFSYTITDNGTTNGASDPKSVAGSATLDITPVNDAPAMASASISLRLGETVVLNLGNISVQDVDNPLTDLSFAVSGVTGGRFELASHPGLSIGGFSYAELASGSVVFVHGGRAAAPSFSVTVSDGVSLSAPLVATVYFDPGSAAGADHPPDLIGEPFGSGSSGGAAGSGAAPSETGVARPIPWVSGYEGRGEPEDRWSLRGAAPPVEDSGMPAGNPSATAVMPSLPARPSAVALLLIEDGTGRRAEVEVREGAVEEEFMLQLVSLQREQVLQAAAVTGLHTGEVGLDDPTGRDGIDLASAAKTAKVVGIVLTAGTVWWALRLSGLLTSLMASLPAWRHLDLLAILPDDEEPVSVWDQTGDAEALRDEAAVGNLLGLGEGRARR